MRRAGPIVLLLLWGACHRSHEPPDLETGHLEWRDGQGTLRVSLRAKPYGYRALDEAGRALARIERRAGEVRLEGTEGQVVVLRREPGGAVTLRDVAGEVRRRLREQPGRLRVDDVAAAPVARLAESTGRVDVYTGGGFPLGSASLEPDRIVLRARDGAVTGFLVGTRDVQAGAVLLMEPLSVDERLALLLWLVGS